MKVLLISWLLWRLAFPYFVSRSERATSLFRTRSTEWSFFISDGAPPLLYFVFKVTIPRFDRPLKGFARGPQFCGRYHTSSAPFPDEDIAHFIARKPWHQTYLFLNLLNRRSITLYCQRHLSLSEAQAIYYDSRSLQVAATRMEANS